MSILVLFVLSVMVLPTQALSADVRYVSDSLSVPIRSGSSTGHRIIKFVKSGAALTVIGLSDDEKYAQVEYDGDKTGWILMDKLMKAPSARVQLKTAGQKLQQSRQTISSMKKQLAELKSEIDDLKTENTGLQNERAELNRSIDDLKVTAANPLALAKKNQRLNTELEKAEATLMALREENRKLGDTVTRDWFIIGSSVSVGSLILGLIITRINWRRKRNSWGDSF